MTDTNPDRRHRPSADPALDGALATLNNLDEIGAAAYYQDGTNLLIAEAQARAATAEAVTNRIRLLRDLLAENISDKPLFLSGELDERYHVELVRLLMSITGANHDEA